MHRPHEIRRSLRAFAIAARSPRAELALTLAAAAIALLVMLTFLLSLPATAADRDAVTPAVGAAAPDVTLADQDGTATSLSALWADKPLVIYFYPKDFTPGCTAQACSLRDANREMREAGLHVVGVSFDTVESHRRFADKHGLPFTLLADPDGEAARAYGVAGSFLGAAMARRVTFLIGTDGRVLKVWDPAGTSQHAEQVLDGARGLGLVAETR